MIPKYLLIGDKMESINSFQILFLLMPGLLSSLIMESLIIRKERNQFNIIIEALVFSVIIYVTYSMIVNKNQIVFKNIFQSLEYKDFFILFGLSVLYGLLFGFLVFKDWFLKPLRYFGITKKTTGNTVWDYILSGHGEKDDCVIVDFSDGRKLFGHILNYSDYSDNQYLFLQRPIWIIEKNNRKTKLLPIHYKDKGIEGILITPEMKIDSIQFFKDDTLK